MTAPVERRPALWMVVTFWTLWACAVGLFGLYVAFEVLWGDCSDWDSSPTPYGYLSLWPFGPGCSMYDGVDGFEEEGRAPSWAWSAALAGLVFAAVAMATWQVRSNRKFMQRS